MPHALLWVLLLLAPACRGPVEGHQGPPAPTRPNFVLILADDLGYGDLGCYGGPATPHLDELAEAGLRLTDCHSAGAVCSPTRASLMTGRYPGRAGIRGVVFADPQRPEHLHGLASEERTLPEELRSVGYATALIGKWHLGYHPPYNPTRHGFDRFRGFVSGNVDYLSHYDQAGAEDWWWDEELRPEEGYTTRLMTRHALEFLEERAGDPFFLYVAHEAPHYPLQGPDDAPIRGPASSRVQVADLTPQEREATYRVMIDELDASVGAIRAKLVELGIADDTVVVFLSDNGGTSLASNGPLRGTKGSLWEGGQRIAGLVAWPGRIEPGTSEATVHSNDWMPTFLGLARGRRDSSLDGLDGLDLTDHLLRGAQLPARDLFWEHGKLRAARRGPWKLVQNNKGEHLLFHLDDDLSEQHDRANSAAALPALVEALRTWEADIERTARVQPADKDL
ncbi:MAG: sulfatase-like hydrolase/transferase [Planctomycetota bacterium]|nr:sulfatase-like hydrolase/transferase [Planctomycetota bacterium]